MNEQTKNESDKKMIYSEDFVDVLSRIDDKVSKDILKLKDTDNVISYIDITDKNDFVSFIQQRNIKDDPWKASARQELKIGKFARKLLGNDISNKEIEDFVNLYKASSDFEQYEKRFEIVDGDDIAYYYHSVSYGSKEGSLGLSCMSFDYCGPFFNIYIDNPNQCKMLILKVPDSNKIKGRALLWKLSKPENKIFMDRVYTNDDSDEMLFINYAKKNKWLYKNEQKYGYTRIVQSNKISTLDMEVQLTKKDFEYYPFMDTFRYYWKSG